MCQCDVGDPASSSLFLRDRALATMWRRVRLSSDFLGEITLNIHRVDNGAARFVLVGRSRANLS